MVTVGDIILDWTTEPRLMLLYEGSLVLETLSVPPLKDVKVFIYWISFTNGVNK